jgi:TRAP transporter 4TM/12TM fusion protein
MRIALVIAFFMGLIPILHRLPVIGPLPRIGPFDAEPYRASVLFLSVLIVLVASPLALKVTKSRTLKLAAITLDIAVGLVMAYACWRFYVDVTKMHTTIVFFQPHQAWTAFAACLCIMYLTYRLWGAPLVVVAGLSLAYFIWSFQGSLVSSLPENLWLAMDDGVLGSVTSIVLSTVFPFIVLGAMLEGTGAGLSLLKITVKHLHRYRGGPAHAAVLGSGLFGMISGSAVANVVGTGVITIPMIKKRGFSPSFAGGVEATASTGGQVMPPIMGAAALVLADFVGVPYVTVMTAALVPALFLYTSLFMTIVFESRRLNIVPEETLPEGLEVSMQDYANLLMIVLPIGTVITCLLMGLSPAGSALLALIVLLIVSFVNPEIRREPFRLVVGFAQGSLSFSRLLMAVACISIVIATMMSTGLPSKLSYLLNGATDFSLLATLILAASACMLLGMGMPTLPAYLTIIIVLGGTMHSFGLEALTAHLFVLYYGVASGITPPVAMTAYAAASISGGNPTMTGLAAVRIGVVIFLLPFFWVYNPMMLVVPEAGAVFSWPTFLYILVRLFALCYFIATAASRFDYTRLSPVESIVRAALGIAVIHPDPMVNGTAIAIGVALILFNRFSANALSKA